MQERIRQELIQVLPGNFNPQVSRNPDTGDWGIRIEIKVGAINTLDSLQISMAEDGGQFSQLIQSVGMHLRAEIGQVLARLIREHYGKV